MLARESLLAFTRATFRAYNFAPHLIQLAAHLSAVETGRINRLLVTMPPRHGKSELCAIRFPCWYLGRNPDKRVILASYAADLAQRFSRQARAVIQTDRYATLFPGVSLAPDSRSAEAWDLAGKRGGMKAVGVGGPLTGHGANLLLIDDPVKNREEANSAIVRQSVWDWYTSTAYTRLEDNGAIVVVMCMTGDTPVLMADGTEMPLRDVRPGDRVATFDNGRLTTSTVRNHRSNGLDKVFRVKTISGTIVYANERHPFLVEEHGQLKWIRLKNLTTAHRIVTVKGRKVNGRAKLAWRMDARRRCVAGDIAMRTTCGRSGQTGIARRHLIQKHGATDVLNIDTESLPPNMMYSARRKKASALSANSRQETMYALTGAANCASTIATKQTPSGAFCATTVISPWDTPKQKRPHSPLPGTSDFTTERIESIEPAGVEEVFDLQIDRTENFIANGLVSHNTRWHEDDLMARLLDAQNSPGGDQWTMLHLPAMTEDNQPLWPEKFGVEDLGRIRANVGEYDWNALYQGRPTPREGAFFKVGEIEIVDALPAEAKRCRGWDKAATAGAGDYTAGTKIAAHQGIFYIEDLARGQWDTAERDRVIRQTAELDGIECSVWGEQEPSSGGKDAARSFLSLLAGFNVQVQAATTNKEARADAFSAQVNAGNVKMLRGPWNKVLIEEFRQFPLGKHDDMVDGASGAFNRLAMNSMFDGKVAVG